jgi:hypothetical protein
MWQHGEYEKKNIRLDHVYEPCEQFDNYHHKWGFLGH